jgi:5-formyltetrahydrofolate cyclo-ligase
MAPPAQDAKRALRRQARAAVRALSRNQRAEASAAAIARLLQQPVWIKAQSVLLYAPLPDELDVWPLLAHALAAGKAVSLPRFVAETNSYAACQVKEPATDCRLGRFAIREPGEHCSPVPLIGLDFILVPAVAFDLRGRRLGRGKGYYDQLLAAVSGTTCGAVFDEQILPEIPIEPHDAIVNCILTPSRWVEV